MQNSPVSYTRSLSFINYFPKSIRISPEEEFALMLFVASAERYSLMFVLPELVLVVVLKSPISPVRIRVMSADELFAVTFPFAVSSETLMSPEVDFAS